MKKEIEAFVNAANEQELEAAWNNLSAEEQRVFEQLMEEDSPEDALAFFAQLYDDTPKEQASETVSISENEIYFKRQSLTEDQQNIILFDLNGKTINHFNVNKCIFETTFGSNIPQILIVQVMHTNENLSTCKIIR